MSIKRVVFSGIFTAAAAALFVNLYFVSDAAVPNMEQRFETFASKDALPEEEQSGDYGFDRAHSYIGFKIKHMGLVDVPGSFKDFTGEITFDADKITNSKVAFTAQMKSVDTRIDARDNHLRSKDFFEVDTYPEMKFESTEIKKKGGRYMVTGNLTMKDVTKEITIPVNMYGPIKDARGAVRMGIVGSTGINRREFNVNYGGDLPNGTPVLADTVIVDIQIESVKKKEEGAEAGN